MPANPAIISPLINPYQTSPSPQESNDMEEATFWGMTASQTPVFGLFMFILGFASAMLIAMIGQTKAIRSDTEIVLRILRRRARQRRMTRDPRPPLRPPPT